MANNLWYKWTDTKHLPAMQKQALLEFQSRQPLKTEKNTVIQKESVSTAIHTGKQQNIPDYNSWPRVGVETF